jgi:hypothetical protein
MFQPQRVLIALVIGVALAALTTLILLNTPVTTWETMQPSTCFVTGTCFCETVHVDDSLRQPSNTVSSYGFVLVGVVVAAASLTRRSSRFPMLYALAFALNAVIVGVGSAYYHASLTFVGQFFDILGMYLSAVFVLVYALERLRGWSQPQSITVYVALNVLGALVQILIPDLRRYTFAIVLIIGLIMEYVYYRQRKPTITFAWLQRGLVIFALAYGIWILDNARLVCAPESWLQGHAAWHLLGAVAVMCLFLYYESETPTASGVV